VNLGSVGVWWSATWRRADDGSADIAAQLEDLGYSALWSSGGFEPGLAKRFEHLLSATARLTVASGIVSIWAAVPDEIARAVAGLDARHPGRFVLGLGASHSAVVENYTRPYAHMEGYLDVLDAAGPAVAKDRRVLAALGPRMLSWPGIEPPERIRTSSPSSTRLVRAGSSEKAPYWHLKSPWSWTGTPQRRASWREPSPPDI